MWLRPSAAASLRELQCVEPSAGLRGKVQLIMRASKRSVPGATALPGWRPQRPEIRPSRKRSRQSLTVLTLQTLAATDPGQRLPASQTKDNTRSPNLIGPAALAPAHPSQLTSLRRTQSERCWHEEMHASHQSDVTVTLH